VRIGCAERSDQIVEKTTRLMVSKVLKPRRVKYETHSEETTRLRVSLLKMTMSFAKAFTLFVGRHLNSPLLLDVKARLLPI
jgi:hypothetical protein